MSLIGARGHGILRKLLGRALLPDSSSFGKLPFGQRIPTDRTSASFEAKLKTGRCGLADGKFLDAGRSVVAMQDSWRCFYIQMLDCHTVATMMQTHAKTKATALEPAVVI